MKNQAKKEHHKSNRGGWLRAAVLGANDGILSTSGLIVGVAASNAPLSQILLTGCAGWVAGALSMAAGEYVSVSSQADGQRADLAIERHALKHHPEAEREELAQIYVDRGLDRTLAREVAGQLMKHDALGAHARDELGITDYTKPRPLQAAGASAAAYSTGAALPILTATLFVGPRSIYIISAASLVALMALGALSARVTGASAWKGTTRVTFWGALAMAVTAGIGHYFGTDV